jgi:hypothetical protein
MARATRARPRTYGRSGRRKSTGSKPKSEMSIRKPTQFIEPSIRARRWFWVIALAWVCVVAVLINFDRWFPVSGSSLDQIEQLMNRSLCAIILRVIFYLAMSLVVIVLTIATVRTKQWPPRGMPVPFRARVTEVRRPIFVWLYASIIVMLHLLMIATSVETWRIQSRALNQVIELVR